MSNINWLGSQDDFPNPMDFPDPDPSVPGLIAVSERIYPGQLARAYQMGIFPLVLRQSTRSLVVTQPPNGLKAHAI